ncbi:TPA: hypothetical protein ACYEM3_003837, partial [Klebsiella pneumoniae]
MTQYNTGNSVPSSAMPDVWDNNATIDVFVNSSELTVITRTGTEVDTLSGIQKKSDDLRVQMAEDGAAVVEETRQNLIPLSRQYMTLAAAQADIANIPEGSTTYYRSPDDSALAVEVINNAGTLIETGRKMPSQQAIDDVYDFIDNNDILAPGRNIYNYRTALDGKYLNESGIVTDNPDYILSDYMPVAANSNYATNYNLRFVHCFDANKNLLSYQEFQTAITT